MAMQQTRLVMYNPAVMNKSSFDLVIFDCDGVLVESEPLACQIYVQMWAELGIKLDYGETLREFHGVTLTRRIESTARKYGWLPPANFVSLFNEHLSALTERELQPVPHIHELLESLTVPKCVASNGSREEINLRLRIAKLAHYFGDSIFSGVEVPQPKPAPDLFLAAAQSFGVQPSRCVVIEDSELGVSAAVAAGMTVYGHATFNSAESLQAAGAIPFASMLEIKEILARDLSPAK
jgi:phosphoglycolate phosphatase